METAYKAAVEAHGCPLFKCYICCSEAAAMIKCTDCRTTFCPVCDEKTHAKKTFCHRTVHFKNRDKWAESRSLLATEFINNSDWTIEKKGRINSYTIL